MSELIWNRLKPIPFAMSACAVYWMLCILASFGPQLEFSLPLLHLAIGSKFFLLLVATFLPAVFCFVTYPECRSTLLKLKASLTFHLVALTIGFTLPFLSYFGSHYRAFPWGNHAATGLVRVFALNLLLAPLWEEIIWRGTFLKKIRSRYPASTAILFSSIGWTAWHGGFIAYLYSEGVPVNVLSVLPLIYFCSGIVLGSIFEMGGGSLWPCVLLHGGFDASTLVYYRSYGRISEFGSYVAELVCIAIAAGILFRLATRLNRSST